MVSWSEMPRSPGHVFYDRLQLVLIEGGFDAFAEASCRPYYAARMPRRPRYFAPGGLLADSERGLEWRTLGLAYRCGRSCDWGAVIGYRTIPGCHGAACRACFP